jgi:hypothetical protein
MKRGLNGLTTDFLLKRTQGSIREIKFQKNMECEIELYVLSAQIHG